MKPSGPLARAFFWLSGASTENLEDCPSWERRKYVAFGATVLVPCVFALIAASYAVSTLTNNWGVIATVALAWAFIILTVDRALLATYRAYQSFFRKVSQLTLRFVVAGLMGITISHPLTLLLFRDTINSEIEKDRDAEIAQVRANFTNEKKQVEGKIAGLTAEIAATQKKWDDSFNAKFLVGEQIQEGPQKDEKKARTELEKKIAEVQQPSAAKLEAVQKEIAGLEEQSKKLQGELDFWQKEFEREVNGQRSGIIGLGPRAKSIQEDQLAWRQEEAKRLAVVLQARTKERNDLRADLAGIDQSLHAESDAKSAALALKQKQETERIEALQRQVQQQQADMFVEQQNQIRATLKAQIETRLQQTKVLQEELVKLDTDENTRVDGLRAEPRRDILKQTLALHRLFEQGAQGGQFALTAYVVLTLLFMLVDTIPVMVKFFSKPGPYDTLVDLDEVRYDKERECFVTNYRRYMNELAGGRLLHLTRHKPLEQALIEGVERSRVAKEFLESLMDSEKAFEARVRAERELLAQDATRDQSERIAMLQQMAEAFYRDLLHRMESFFAEANVRRAVE